MPSKRKASPALTPDSAPASRKSKRLAEAKPDLVVKQQDDSDFESEPVLSTKKKSTRAKSVNNKKVKVQEVKKEDHESDDFVPEEPEPAEDEEVDEEEHGTLKKSSPILPVMKAKRVEKANNEDCFLYGDPIPAAEAHQKWPERYLKVKANGTKDVTDQNVKDPPIQAKCHYLQAKVDVHIYNLGDDAHVQADDGDEDYICKIIEFFKGVDGVQYFRAQWFYRAKDTVIKKHDQCILKQRVFLSEVKDDNPIDCLLTKLKIVAVPSNATVELKKILEDCDFYYDMMYRIPYSSFTKLSIDDAPSSVSSTSTISTDSDAGEIKEHVLEKKLLDLYSGCGAMSTGLCLGANSNGVKLVTKWSVDFNKYACDSLRLNHPETQVRNELASDFLLLIKEWVQLCVSFSLVKSNYPAHPGLKITDNMEEDEGDNGEDSGGNQNGETFEVEELLEVCYGDPNDVKKPGLYFKVRWQGYGPEEDTWEPLEGLSDCPKKIQEFVTRGFQTHLLPLPGDVDVICGGPPCQGISGFNRFRNKENPLSDSKNKQLDVYMDIVEFLKPRFVLMENVVDLLKFADGFLGRYALSRLVGMNYQARAGMMAAGYYGLPQFRMRVFMWGALMTEKLPQYPLPTHDAVDRGVVPTEFEMKVAKEEGEELEVKDKLFLADALSDLPLVENAEKRDVMPYIDEPKTEFQRFIRLGKDGVLGENLYDHRPLQLNEDDYQRVCQIPKRKGANYRDLPGVRVRADNKAELDPDMERVYLPSKKPLVPDYALSFVRGTSTKPFRRLWWDETVATVVTRAEPHNQAVLHPLQDRVLTVRENARLQGFPDYYQLTGPIKERYMQVGNAVAVPVARALGYSLAMAMKGVSGEKPTFKLPVDFPFHVEQNEVSQ